MPLYFFPLTLSFSREVIQSFNFRSVIPEYVTCSCYYLRLNSNEQIRTMQGQCNAKCPYFTKNMFDEAMSVKCERKGLDSAMIACELCRYGCNYGDSCIETKLQGIFYRMDNSSVHLSLLKYE